MVTKSKSKSSDSDARVVRRVKATETKPVKAEVSEKPTKVTRERAPVKAGKNPGREKSGKGNYFTNSWRELRQTRWPNRRAAWSLTLAVILFSAFFVGLILLVDWIFEYIIREVIL